MNDGLHEPGFSSYADRCTARIPEGMTGADIAASYGRIGTDVELAADRRVLWQPGQQLRVRFLDGTQTMRDTVAAIAKTWEDHANITFDFGDFAEAEIRISFHLTGNDSGYWSVLGKTSMTFDQSLASMSLSNGWDDDFMTGQIVRVRRTVLHEFGHALGLLHEHQSPAADIPWDVEKVYAWYAANQGWSKNEVDQQVLDPDGGPWTLYTEHDPTSIMQYPVENFLTKGNYEIPWSNELSPVDKAGIRILYPFD